MSRNTVVKMYRTLNEEKASYLNFSHKECQAAFCVAGAPFRPLTLTATGTATDNAYELDGQDDWDAEVCVLKVSQDFTLHSLPGLFYTGADSLMPLAGRDATLGLAAVWWSNKSQIRGCEEIATFNYEQVKNSPEMQFSFMREFAPGELSGRLEVRYVLFLKEAGEKLRVGFARDSGTLLGDVGIPLQLVLDGEGSVFPLSVENDPQGPLWRTEISIDDPFEETFTEEYFNVILNEGHPAFKELGRDKGYNTALYHEVFAGALEELFLYLRENFKDDFQAASLAEVTPGTIAYAALYMVQTFNLNTDNIAVLHNTIRAAVAEQMKGATGA